MATSFLSDSAKRSDRIVAISLGSRTTKAVEVFRRNGSLVLKNYVVVDAPVYDKGLSSEILAPHLKSVWAALDTQTTNVVLSLGAGDSLFRLMELPPMAESELRTLLKFNSKNYLQEDLRDHIFDCRVVQQIQRVSQETDTTNGGVPPTSTVTLRTTTKARVLVGATNTSVLQIVQESARKAGLKLEQVGVSQMGPANALMATPDFVSTEAVAMVDFGFKYSTIGILCGGQLLHNRVVAIGGDKITSSLASAMNITYAAAEGLKTVALEKVQPKLEAVMTPLIDELRASINSFEGYEDKKIEHVYVSGGSARSAIIVQALEHQLMLPCRSWDPTTALVHELPGNKANDVKRDAPQLVGAVGSAMAWFNSALPQINLLAEEQEAEELRRRDPMRWGFRAAAVLVMLMFVWVALVGLRIHYAKTELASRRDDLQTLEKTSQLIASNAQKAGELEHVLSVLDRHVTNRFLWAPTLDALQYTTLSNIQIVHLSIDRNVVNYDPPRSPGRPTAPGTSTETITLNIQAKDYGENPTIDAFIEAITASPYFKQNLRNLNSVRLKDRSSAQVDPLDPSRTFVLFTIECIFRDRTL
ncbi:MAG: pilus assembly protein PilM [Verrucomicrobiota bacterium]